MGKTIRSTEYKTVTRKLRKARKEAGLSQLLIAKMLKKSQSYISKVEAGEQRIDVIELKNLAKLYCKSLDYFIK